MRLMLMAKLSSMKKTAIWPFSLRARAFNNSSSFTRFIHGLGIAIHQQHLMARWRERLEQKHPQMRHEITRDAIVGVIKQNFHRVLSDSAKRRFAACFTARKKSATPQRRLPVCG